MKPSRARSDGALPPMVIHIPPLSLSPASSGASPSPLAESPGPVNELGNPPGRSRYGLPARGLTLHQMAVPDLNVPQPPAGASGPIGATFLSLLQATNGRRPVTPESKTES